MDGPKAPMRFDRIASTALLSQLVRGAAKGLIARRHRDRGVTLDVQLRKDGATTWASLYCGLSAVLSVVEANGQFRLETHKTYDEASGLFKPSWRKWMSPGQLETIWPDVELFLDWVLSDANVALRRYKSREGAVHSIMCAGRCDDYRIIQREAVIAFDGKPLLNATMQRLNEEINEIFTNAPRPDVPWWIGTRDRGKVPNFGNELDLLGIDSGGRLLVIEVKPSKETKGIAAAPAQVRVYTRLFRDLIDKQEDFVAILNEMLRQRVKLGLSSDGPDLDAEPQLVPVVAIGHGTRGKEVLKRLREVHQVLPPLNDPRIDPLEVWLMGAAGEVVARWIPDSEPVPSWP